MKSLVIWTAIVFALAKNACAGEAFEDYDSFYAGRPRAVFGEPIKFERDSVYILPDEPRIYVKLRPALEGKFVRIEIAPSHITVNGTTYRFTQAMTFPGEHPSDIYPPSADVFLASKTNNRPAALCVEGASNGSGEANRHTQIYLLLTPLSTNGKATFLHLPSLLSSCRAITETKDGKVAFPKNTYLLDAQQESRAGLLLSYYTFEHQRFAPVHNEVRLRFTRPEVPFQFEIQE